MIVVLMGVSGSAKSTVGAALAARLHWPMIDVDVDATVDAQVRAIVEALRGGMASAVATEAP